ncbi:unnamed protein product [Plutella xylostella]|uniref:(diamondback moth) hypothetical protein n=1 Tax=Plutella xylostella TaxID=51655 RepID=A0A8S4E0W0_PLUXY|nr:unnamed protein product [Plutella xylostella]
MEPTQLGRPAHAILTHYLISSQAPEMSVLGPTIRETHVPPPITAKTRKAELLKQKANQKMSQERMLHHNTVTIVENSYVCPFKTRISNYYCYYCKDIFTDCNELRIHTLKHDPQYFEDHMEAKKITRIDITQIDCRLCNEKISNLEEFKKHLSAVHKKIIYPADTNEFLTFKLSMENLNCLECGCSFPFIDKLIEHMTDHFGKYVCDMCGACFIEESTLCQHIRGHKKVDTNFPCEICGKNFKSNYSRQLHTATVHEKRPVVHCYKCEASFLSYAQRNRHLINVHGDKRKFACQSCDKVFDVRKTMVEHTRKYHLQVCRHQCDVCDQRFYAPSQLKEHKVTHTGERNYTCDYCDKSYPRRQSLQDHIRSHTNDRRYKCNVCNSTFTQSGSLKSHMKTHEGFEMGEGFPS